jgi:hypothetical protein
MRHRRIIGVVTKRWMRQLVVASVEGDDRLVGRPEGPTRRTGRGDAGADGRGTSLARGCSSEMRRTASKKLSVTIVSSKLETLQSLDAYLRGAGVTSNGTRLLDRLLEMTPRSSTAVVVFPDEYGPDLVERSVSALGRERPDVLLVVVTSEPQRFERMLVRRHTSTVPLVIPKPAWAWTILDAIRTRLDANQAVDGSS